MDFSLYKKIVDELAEYDNIQIALSVGGESLLHNKIVPMLEYAFSKGIKNIGIVTNGNLFRDEISKAFLRYSEGLINFSLDGFEESHNRIRKGSDYKQVVGNIEQLLDNRKSRGQRTPTVCVNLTKFGQKEQEIASFVEHWLKLVDHVYIREPLDENIRFIKNNDLNKQILHNSRRPCLDLWINMVILWNGDVTLCCHDVSGKGTFGLNAADKSIRSIWAGKAYKKIREYHTKGQFHKLPICRDCQAWCKNYTGYKSVKAGCTCVFWGTKWIYTANENSARSR